MKPLPIGYRIVGGLVIAYALFTGWVTAILFDSFSPGSPSKSIKVLDWLLPCAYAYQSVALFLAGCLFVRTSGDTASGGPAAFLAAAWVLAASRPHDLYHLHVIHVGIHAQ